MKSTLIATDETLYRVSSEMRFTMCGLCLSFPAARRMVTVIALFLCVGSGATGGETDQLGTQQHSHKASRSSAGSTKARSAGTKPNIRRADRLRNQQSPAATTSPKDTTEKERPSPPPSNGHSGGVDWKWLVGLVVGIILGIIFGRRWYYSRRSYEARQGFEELFTHPVHGQLPANREGLTDCFFRGAEIAAHAIDYVRLDLDAPRQRLLDRAAAALSHETKGLCVIPVVGGRQQGKTVFLARLAHNLGTDRSREVWLAKLTQASEVLKHPEVVRRYFGNHHVGLLGGASSCGKRLTLIVDDAVDPDQITGLAFEEKAGIDFIRDLAGLPVTVIVSSVSAVFPESMPSVHPISGFELEEEDIKPILDSWIKNGMFDENTATELMTEASVKSLYGKQLFAFLSVTFEKSAARQERSHHLAKFDDDYANLPTAPELAVLPIASCQLAGVAVPYRLIRKLDPAFKLDHSFITLERYQNDAEDKVYECGGIFLPRWLLREKFRMARFGQLHDAYESLFDAAAKLADFGKFQSEKDFILRLLLRLAIGLTPGIFEGSSAYEAAALMDRYDQLIDRCVHDVTENVSALLDWARIHTKLHRWDNAAPLFNRIIDLQREKARDDVLNTFRLVSAIVHSPDIELLRRAVSLLPEFMRVAIDDPELRAMWAPKVLHVYTDYVWRLDGPAAAIEALKKHLEPQGKIKPDGLLYMRLGQLHEAEGGNWNEAKEAYKRAAELDQMPQMALNCKHRYAVFLSRFRLPDAPEPDVLFSQAVSYATIGKLESEPTLVAWAQHKMTLAWRSKVDEHRAQHVRDAKRLLDDALAGYRARYVVEPHAWQVLITLISDWERYLSGDPRSHREQAEKLCREVTENEFIPWRSRLMANHTLGMLVGLSSAYSFKGRRRPNPGEALRILRGSFESVGPQRSDSRRKTFQDALAHRAIKDVYEQVLKEGRPHAHDPAEKRQRLWLKREEFHGRCAFEGLGGSDAPLPGWRTRAYLLHTRDWFAYFLWNVKTPAFPESRTQIIAEAERLYLDSIHDLDRWGWAPTPNRELGVWPHAFQIYLHFGLFLCLMRSGYQPGFENRSLNKEVLERNKEVLELLKHQMEMLILALPCAHPKITRQYREAKQFEKLLKYLRTYRNVTTDATFDVLEAELLRAWKDVGTMRLPKTA